MLCRVGVGDEHKLLFVSIFLGTQLECVYGDGSAHFRSDSVSTISILKDFLTSEATTQQIRVRIGHKTDDASSEYVLRLIRPMLEYQMDLSRRVSVIEGLRELEASEGRIDCFCDEYADILRNADDLLLQHKQQSCHLKRLYGIITDLFIDHYKFKSKQVWIGAVGVDE